MWQDILNIVPRPLVLACAIYGVATWFVTGPIVAAVLITIGAASRVGTLVVHSWSLRGSELEDAIIWDIATVRRVRAALDEAMLSRADNGPSAATHGQRRQAL